MGNTKQTKYPLLSNKAWLEESYLKKLLSTTEIAEEIGCTKDGVRAALCRHEIPRRTPTETNKIKKDKAGYGSIKYKKLNDKDWLINKYVNEKWPLEKLSDFVGAKNHNSVRQALMRINIPVRNISEGLTVDREDDGFMINEDVINGCLLGDGYLQKYNKSSDVSYPRFEKKNIHYDHIGFVGKSLFKNNWEERVKPGTRLLNGKRFSHFQLSSLTHKELISFYEKWYPKSNNFIKVVPQDIEINPTVLLHWFLDDGSSSFRVRKECKKQGRKQIALTFYSQSFTEEENQMLQNKMKNSLDLRTSIRKTNSGTGFILAVPQLEVPKFFNIIGPPPVASLAYKWK